MLQSYTLENFRRDLTHLVDYIDRGDEGRLEDARRMLRVLEAIPAAERESRSPFLTPQIREQIADASNVAVQDLDRVLLEYRRLAVLIAGLERGRNGGTAWDES